MKKFRKSFAALLALAMVLSLVPALSLSASAATISAEENLVYYDQTTIALGECPADQEYIIAAKGTVPGDPEWEAALTPDEDGYVVFEDLQPATVYIIYTREVGEMTVVTLTVVTSFDSIGCTYDDGDVIGSTITVETEPAESNGEITYQWFYDNRTYDDDDSGAYTSVYEPIEGETEASYTLKPEDEGKILRVNVYVDGVETDYMDFEYIAYGVLYYNKMDGSEPVELATDLVYGDKIQKPADPVRDGFVFGGWYFYEDFAEDSKVDFDKDTIKWSYTELRAKWILIADNASGAKIENAADIDKLIDLEDWEKDEGVSLILDCEDASGSVPEADLNAIKSVLGDNAVALFFNIELYKQVGTMNPEKITETKGKVKISIDVPKDLIADGRTFAMVRVHGGKAEIINGTFDAKTGKFTFETDKFSTYALVYSDESETVASTDAPVAETAGFAMMPLFVIAILKLGAAALAQRKEYEII
ncbi:MAG: InlB B-repeat-containing protein [Clostridia bacterium]|nr:InlB B-repeat-containing protein [Clostridia bacterium]